MMTSLWSSFVSKAEYVRVEYEVRVRLLSFFEPVVSLVNIEICGIEISILFIVKYDFCKTVLIGLSFTNEVSE